MTMKQLNNSLEMMRKACAPKYKVDEASLDGLKSGDFPPEPDTELKCYTMCIAQMAGTLTKKGEVSFSKTSAQIEAMLPPELKAPAKEALNHCKNAQASYKDPCDRVFYSVKCAAEFNRDVFIFP
ncbi:general odorant-binding protein lush isoform X2 [Topomyia yanbarensis]|nr:general odorant-binding protein lush isoform X2 [Topomyia yanbarensis]XP_058836778.1 general odorant-binding protein lush isoform X2 [Topomyia yanbarensis]XP_058836779.1 general odorant-binding protein lush isoform X2 [Topomyia yanbarensis]